MRSAGQSTGHAGAGSGEATAGNTALFAYPGCKDHDTGYGHPERPERYDAVMGALAADGLADRMPRLEPRPIEETHILTCHTPEYLSLVKRDVARGRDVLSTGDTTIGSSSLDVARRTAGGVLGAVDAVCGGQVPNAFCVARPPGHHACRERGMGFCILNNIALAARYAQTTYGLGKVMILDWDVHHGNGTQDVFYEDPNVFFFSTHQYPWYPGTGDRTERGGGMARGTTLNCPFPAGTTGREILDAFRKEAVPAADFFQPELILISAGFDGHESDPLGQFTMHTEHFADLTRIAMDIADRHAGGRTISILEGGYELLSLAASVRAHVETMMEVST